MPLPRTAQFGTSTYSARRIVFIWITICIAGWAVIFMLIKGLIFLVDAWL